MYNTLNLDTRIDSRFRLYSPTIQIDYNLEKRFPNEFKFVVVF